MAWTWNNRGPPPPPPPSPAVTMHECPYCGKLLLTLQGLGVHLDWHRRNLPVAPHAPPAAPAPAAPAPIAVETVPLLAPNPAFWEEYRRGGPTPVEIDFMGLGQLAAALARPVVANGDVPESSGNARQTLVDKTRSKE